MFTDFLSIIHNKTYRPKTPPFHSRYHKAELNNTQPISVLHEKNSNLSIKNISKSDLKKINVKLPKKRKPAKCVTPFDSLSHRKLSKYEMLTQSLHLPSLDANKVDSLQAHLVLLKQLYLD